VAVACSSPHRAESFDAGRYVMEQIKRRLPIWKKEEYVDGDEGWVRGTRPPEPAPRSAHTGASPAGGST
jgi:molybdopterin synthase catalytic subunit